MGLISKYIQNYFSNKKKLQYTQALQQLAVTPFKIHHHDAYVNFSHIGLNGDVVYSIPAMLALAGNKKIRLYIDVNQKSLYTKGMKHYNNDKILTPKSVEFLKPLLLNASIEVVDILDNEVIDYDLNEFRKYPFDYRMGHICRWYFLAFGITYNITKPWLIAKPDNDFKDCIVVARSFRYRTLGIDYSFLKKYQHLYFVGMKDEFEDMQQAIPTIEYVPVSNALELASIIAGCKLFIGNQSFPFAVAEGLKVKRVLEVCYECPNVIVDGDNGYDFCFQLQFEKIINEIL